MTVHMALIYEKKYCHHICGRGEAVAAIMAVVAVVIEVVG